MLFAAFGGKAEPTATRVPPTEPPTAAEVAEVVAGAESDIVNGETLFNANCMACHGLGGVGVEGLGKPFTTSEFVDGLTDAELVAFVKKGRGADDPLNMTGVAMLPSGGNPSLTDAQLADIVAYVRTLHE